MSSPIEVELENVVFIEILCAHTEQHFVYEIRDYFQQFSNYNIKVHIEVIDVKRDLERQSIESVMQSKSFNIEANIVLCILSPEFFETNIELLMYRLSNKNVQLVLFSPCDWKNSPLMHYPIVTNSKEFIADMYTQSKNLVLQKIFGSILGVTARLLKDVELLIEIEKEHKTGFLDLSSCKLKSLPVSLEELVLLKKIDLHDNQLQKITRLSSLVSLEELDISSNRLKNLEGIENLLSLKTLNFSNNKISNLFTISLLVNLEILNASNNEIDSLTGIEKAINISNIDFSFNRFKNIKIPAEFNQLEVLNLANNQIENIEFNDSINSLLILNLYNNNIESIAWLQYTPNLTSLYLGSNHIKLFTDIELLPATLEVLIIENNPLQNIPLTVINGSQQGEGYNCLQDLKNFFSEFPDQAIHEVKLILTGNSDVGKSKFAEYFINEKFTEDRMTTHGMQVFNFTPTQEIINEYNLPNDTSVMLYDFGGQEYFHNTHKLYFSNNAVYILLWEEATNKNEPITTTIEKSATQTVQSVLEHFDAEYWLNNIRFFAKESPILIAHNKADIPLSQDRDVSLLPTELLKKYGCKRQYTLSVREASKKNKEFEFDYAKWRDAIYTQISNYLSTAKEGISLSSIREKLKGEWELKNYCTYKELLELIEEIKLKIHDPKASARNNDFVINYFKNQGLLLFAKSAEELSDKDIIFTNPQWVSEQIYKLLNNHVLLRNGFFDKHHIDTLITEQHLHSQSVADALISLMENFKIIFKNKNEQYIVPQYLPEVPNIHFSQVKRLLDKPKFVIQFAGFLPKYFVHKLIAYFSTKNDEASFYKYGVKIQHEENIWLLDIAYHEKKIYVYTNCNKPYEVRKYFNDILYQLEILHEDDIYSKVDKLNIRNSPNGEIVEQVTRGQYLGKKTGVKKETWIEFTSETMKKKNWVNEMYITNEKPLLPESLLQISLDNKLFVSFTQLWNEFRTLQESDSTYIQSENGVLVPKELFKMFYETIEEVRTMQFEQVLKPHKLFISYSSKDTDFMRRFEIHLKPLKRSGLIQNWHDRMIEPGTQWDETIKKNMDEADLIVFLMSPDFINTDYIFEHEVPQAMKQEQMGNTKIVTVELKECSWQRTQLRKYQQITDEKGNNKARIIIQNPDNDAAWKEIINVLEKKINNKYNLYS